MADLRLTFSFHPLKAAAMIKIEISRSSFWLSIGRRHVWWHREDGLMFGRD